jgi:hypothetical protein
MQGILPLAPQTRFESLIATAERYGRCGEAPGARKEHPESGGGTPLALTSRVHPHSFNLPDPGFPDETERALDPKGLIVSVRGGKALSPPRARPENLFQGSPRPTRASASAPTPGGGGKCVGIAPGRGGPEILPGWTILHMPRGGEKGKIMCSGAPNRGAIALGENPLPAKDAMSPSLEPPTPRGAGAVGDDPDIPTAREGYQDSGHRGALWAHSAQTRPEARHKGHHPLQWTR